MNDLSIVRPEAGKVIELGPVRMLTLGLNTTQAAKGGPGALGERKRPRPRRLTLTPLVR
ncbi:MAG: hypothetical protein ACQSGP_22795 [Frankia sp.]